MSYDAAEQGEIRADVQAMYQAGKVDLPARATQLAGVAGSMGDAVADANSRAAQMGDWPVLQNALDLAADCQNGVARSVLTLTNLAAAVVAQADDFVARDAYAAEVFNGLADRLRGPADEGPPPPAVVDKDQVLEPGDGTEYEENPDVPDPADELADRDDRLDDAQDDIPGVEDDPS